MEDQSDGPNGSLHGLAKPPTNRENPREKTKLLELANKIKEQVTEIQNYLEESNQPNPSFTSTDEPVNYDGIDDIRAEALHNLMELQELLYTPKELLHSQNATSFTSRHLIDRYRISRLVPLTGSTTYEALAWSTMLPVKLLRRILRHAMAQRIFYEPQPGHVAHTQASRVLAEDGATRDYFGTTSNEIWPAAARICDAVEMFPAGTGAEETGYWLAHGRTLAQTLDASPVKRARYDNAMNALSSDRSFSLEYIVKGYDWAALGKATVVDLGGGVGWVSRSLAKAFPLLDFVVQDWASVIANAAVEDPEIKDRIRFMEHDIVAEQPIKNADVYFMRRVLMEKTDAECVEVFKALKPALKKDAVILVQDPMVPEPGTCPTWRERRFRESDILALAITRSMPRETEDWRAIFEKAGPGFVFKGVTMPRGSNAAFAHAVWDGASLG